MLHQLLARFTVGDGLEGEAKCDAAVCTIVGYTSRLLRVGVAQYGIGALAYGEYHFG